MSRQLGPNQLVRELSLSLAALIPYARLGAPAGSDVSVELANALALVKRSRDMLSMPWTSVLEVNLQHLSASERDALTDGNTPDPFVYCTGPAGGDFLFYPPTTHVDATALGPGLAAVHLAVQEGGFRYVRLSEDCAFHPTLSVLS